MLRLAKENRVLWVNSIGNRKPTASARDFRRILKKITDFTKGNRQVHERIYVYSPLAIPFFSSALARRINRKALEWSLRRECRKLGFSNPITWTFVPASSDVAGTLGERAVIYHCVDEFSEFTGTDKAAILDMERRLMEKSRCVIVSSDRLYATKNRHNPNTFLVTHGVDIDHFRKACDPKTVVPEQMQALKGPVIGFFGLIADWVDLELIKFLAESRPQWNVAMIGKIDTDISMFNGVSNVHFLGQKSYEELPAYTKGFDVAILPFVMNELTLAANPLKLREYLAAGLPVVASAIPEAEKLKPALRTANGKQEFLTQIENIIATGNTGPQLSISIMMDPESWDARVAEMSRIVFDAQKSVAA